MGFNHFWRAPNDEQEGDLIYIQGHSAPGMYARAFLEGRLSEQDLDSFRQEVDGKGLSLPHPWLMPDFWQFPTVSMGLGPLMAIYQARFLESTWKPWSGAHAGTERCGCSAATAKWTSRNRWAPSAWPGPRRSGQPDFRHQLQPARLDGPVRGNGKIIQELEGEFRGAGWNV